jgi:hypothetical protein
MALYPEMEREGVNRMPRGGRIVPEANARR